MKKSSRISVVLGLAFLLFGTPLVLAAGRWDSSWERIGQVSPNNSSVNLAVRNTGAQAPYVKVECGTNNAYVGNGIGNTTACTTTACSLVQFSLGEKYYSQLVGTENYIAVYSTGSFTCQVFRSKN